VARLSTAPGILGAVFCGIAAAAAHAQAPAGLAWTASADLVHRRLVERADDGTRQVEESGPMLRLALAALMQLPAGGALRAGAGAAMGRLDYDGQTQGGTPLSTTSRHSDLTFDVGWRPFAAAAWGESWLVLRALQQRRRIAATAAAGGLDETSTLWMPGVRWSHRFDADGWRLQPSVEVRGSARHRMEIDYGGVFDSSDLRGGRRWEAALAIEASAANSPWNWGVEWTHVRQSASPRQALYRGGSAVGTVRQPRVEMDDVAVRVRRAF
jgi:hypothetical protein